MPEVTDDKATTKRRGERGKGKPREAAVWDALGRVYRQALRAGGDAVIDPETGRPALDGNGRVIRNPPSAALLREARAWSRETARMREQGKFGGEGKSKALQALAALCDSGSNPMRLPGEHDRLRAARDAMLAARRSGDTREKTR